MGKYIVRRIPGFVLTLLILSLGIVWAMRYMPGDMLGEKTGSLDIYYNETDREGYEKYKAQYRREAAKYYMDLPVFFLGIEPAFYSDSLQQIYPFPLRNAAKELSAAGRNKQLALYSIKQIEAFVFNPESDLLPWERELSYAWLQHRIGVEDFKNELEKSLEGGEMSENWRRFAHYFLSEYAQARDGSMWPRIRYRGQNVLSKIWFGEKGEGGWIRGDFGNSIVDNRKRTEHLSDHIWPSLRLGIFAFILSLIMGSIMGFRMAKIRKRWPDFVLLFVYSIPLFVLAAVWTNIWSNAPLAGIFETYGEEQLSGDLSDIGEFFRYVTLPAFCMALPMSVYLAKIIKDRIEEQGQMEYVRAAKSRGISERDILNRHITANIRPYYWGLMGQIIPDFIIGSIIIEYIFARNGLGQLFLQSIYYRDLPMLLILVWLFGLIHFAGNSLSDILISISDKRVKWA